MFGTKHKARIAELEATLATERTNHALDMEKLRVEHARELSALRNQVDYLVRTIRQIDDKLFSISQCTNWESMRPRINSLVEDMTARKVAESKRINDLVADELRKTYEPTTKQIGKG